MKSNKGITLISLVVYIIGLSIVISTMTTFSSNFYKDVDSLVIKQNSYEQYSKFLSYITRDVNSENVVFVQSGRNGQKCIIFKFDTGEEHQYIYKNNKIYYLNTEEENEKKITLCTEVSSINKFNYSNETINIDINIGEENFNSSLNVKIKN